MPPGGGIANRRDRGARVGDLVRSLQRPSIGQFGGRDRGRWKRTTGRPCAAAAGKHQQQKRERGERPPRRPERMDAPVPRVRRDDGRVDVSLRSMVAEFANYRSWIEWVPIVAMLTVPLVFRGVPVVIDAMVGSFVGFVVISITMPLGRLAGSSERTRPQVSSEAR